MTYQTILYATDGPVATISLNRPERLNTIVPPMPEEIASGVDEANLDGSVKVIVLRGIGRSFCAGFDFGPEFEEGYGERLYTDGAWDPGKDLIGANSQQLGYVSKFMSLWHSPKPVIAQVHGWCVGGGSDMALCADLVVASEDAQIGTPYARMWGCYLTGMWIYRLGLARCKWHALTGEPLSGQEAAEVELINRAVPFETLECTVHDLALKLARLPASQLAAMKLVVNKAYESLGISSTQTLGLALDGYMRNTPDAQAFMQLVREEGVGAAIRQRDGQFADYSSGPAARQPDGSHVIEP